jgi:hypothetical protein
MERILGKGQFPVIPFIRPYVRTLGHDGVHSGQMISSRRTFFGWLIAAMNGDLYRELLAQDQPQRRGQSIPNPGMLIMPGPTRDLSGTAVAMTPGDVNSIRAVVEVMFKMPDFQMPEVMAAVVKQRLIDAQIAYFDGKNLGVTDEAVVDALNSLATAFETPDYARFSLFQVEFVRGRLASDILPTLYKQVNRDIDVPMSPLEALYLMAVLIEQKIQNEAYQVAPAEWDRDVYPRAIEQERATKELRRRIASGEIQAQPIYELRNGRATVEHNRGDLLWLLQQRILAMSEMDGLKLFNETFARLGIK